MDGVNFSTLKVRIDEPVCFIQMHRPEANNTINATMLLELNQVLTAMTDRNVVVVVLEGLPEVFCFGADFSAMADAQKSGQKAEQDPELVFGVWQQLSSGPFITISHVRGKANAGGVGFVAASDIVLADDTAEFSLSELLFGLIPACVMPFLIRRIGFQKAHYLTSMTQPVSVQQAHAWGLVDMYDAQSQVLLRKHLMRLRRLSKKAIIRYKAYMNGLNSIVQESKQLALATNKEVFNDEENLAAISRYVEHGIFPWE